MEWLEKLHGQTVGLDTAPLIFFIEEHADYIDLLDPFFADLDQGKFRVVTSVVTLLEVLIHPLRQGNEALAQQYNDVLLSSSNISTLPLTFAIAQEAAELRARHKLKTPDAIQLATSIQHGATAFLTNDRDFPQIPGIAVMRLKDITL